MCIKYPSKAIAYIRFENLENNSTFEQQYEQITGRKQTMGLEELILYTEHKRGLMEGEKRGEKLGEKRGIKLGEKRRENQVIMNMLRKNLTDEMIADFTGVSIDYVRKMRVSADKRIAINN